MQESTSKKKSKEKPVETYVEPAIEYLSNRDYDQKIVFIQLPSGFLDKVKIDIEFEGMHKWYTIYVKKKRLWYLSYWKRIDKKFLTLIDCYEYLSLFKHLKI